MKLSARFSWEHCDECGSPVELCSLATCPGEPPRECIGEAFAEVDHAADVLIFDEVHVGASWFGALATLGPVAVHAERALWADNEGQTAREVA